MTRQEHLQWCKGRANQEFQYYLKTESLDAACRNGVTSMCSDLGKHPETQNLTQLAVGIGMFIRNADEFKRFVERFN